MIAGIDWSITSPAVCIAPKEDFSLERCKIIVQTERKSRINEFPNLYTYRHLEWTAPEERYHNMMSRVLPELLYCDRILIEDYAFAAKGKIFNIAECTEVLLYNLWLNGKTYEKIPPTVIKKFATGKGNANKDSMHDAFVIDTGVDMMKSLGTKNTNSPVSDIVDSYFICKYGAK